MGMWSRISGLARKTAGSIEDWFREFASSKTASGIVVNQVTAMQVTTVLACVRIRSQDVAKLPPKIYQIASDGSRTEAKKHFLYQIFRKPNDWQTWFEFCEQMQVALLLRGNAYAVVVRDGRAVPKALIPINPDRVSIWEAESGEIFYQITRTTPHDMAVLKAFPEQISADDVFHLRWASSNSLVGMSPIGLCAEAVGLAKAQEKLAANLMGNGARPSGVLSTPKRLSDNAYNRLRAQWNAIHGGVENTGKTVIAEEGLTWSALTLNSVDLEFIAARKLQVDEICRMLGVSPAKVGVTDGGVARAFEQIQLAHYSDSIHPDLVRWEQKLTFYFNIPDDLEVTFDETELLRTDLINRANAARILQVSGIAVPNEGRRSFRLNPYIPRDPDKLPDGDTLFVPNNVVPIDMAGTATGAGPGSDQTGAPAPGGDGDPAALPSG